MQTSDEVVYVDEAGARQSATVTAVGDVGPTGHERLDLKRPDGHEIKGAAHESEGGRAFWVEVVPPDEPVDELAPSKPTWTGE